jgi:hypothetical protein
MTEMRFHEGVLQEGCMPIGLLRAYLLDLPLSCDMKPNWKFSDEAMRP